MYRSENIVLKNKFNKDLVFDYRFVPNNKKKALVIFSHGFKGFKDWGQFNLIADYFAQQGLVFCKLNFSFNGTTAAQPYDFADLEAFGHNNFSKEIHDLETVLHYFETHLTNHNEIDTNNIHFMGHSKGGATSLLAFHENKQIRSAILWAPVLDIIARYTSDELNTWRENGVIYIPNSRTNQEMPLYYQLAEDTLAQKDRFDIPTILTQLDRPVKIIHGQADQTVLADDNTTLLNKINSSWIDYKIFPDTNHVFGGEHPFNATHLPKDSLLACEMSVQFISNL